MLSKMDQEKGKDGSSGQCKGALSWDIGMERVQLTPRHLSSAQVCLLMHPSMCEAAGHTQVLRGAGTQVLLFGAH